ncbi:Multidrug resistance-associated protein 1 [Halotydeus destructor]|nr:Multidrug resistance-associated protein 1 [Halotydeus destructor]
MDGFCKSEFWDYNVTWYTESPDFTPCFHDTALVWAPCAFLWLLSPFEIYRIRSTKLKVDRIPWTLIAMLKIVLAISLAFLSSLEMMNALASVTERSPVEYYTPAIKLATFSFATVLISLNRKKAIQASGTLFLFWLLFTIGSIATYRSVLTDLLNSNTFTWSLNYLVYVVKVFSVALVTAEFVMCCFSDALPVSFVTPGLQVKNLSPEWNASFLSRLLFTWFDGLIKTGYKRPLVMSDMYDLSEEFNSVQVYKKFCKHWSYPVQSTILIPLLKTFWPRLLGASLLKLFSTVLTFVSPSVLDYFLVWLANDEPFWHGIFYAAIMFIAPFAQSLINSQYDYMMALSGMQMKTSVISALHRKALRMSPTAKGQFTTGQIVNLMSLDTQRIVGYVGQANTWWVAPLQITIAMYLLWQQLGVATIAGIVVMIILIPLNAYITTKWRKIQRALMLQKDKRSKLMNEIINGIRVLKMYAWETSFSDQVKNIRKDEIELLKTQTKFMSWTTFSNGCAPIFVALFSFMTFTLVNSNNVLDPSKTFVSLSLFNIVRMPLMMIPMLISSGAMFFVAKKRMDDFLGCDELDPEEIGRKESLDNAIEITDGEFTWERSNSISTLRGIDVKITKSKLVAVVGTVGSGKSSLISALLGEMEKISGSVNISGKVAYVPQQAWIQNATVKHNIIFTGATDSSRYDEVLETCALKPDLRILNAGDLTEIGEKGINLSGGQKQRVSLARAVYANCDVYLLDDPLSAVDSHVGKHIFDKVIGPNGLLKDKTRVLVTHKVALLPHVDEIVVMKDGEISEQGSYLELLERKGAFADFLLEYLAETNDDEDELADIKAMVAPELERRMSKLSEASFEKDASLPASHRSVQRSISAISETQSGKDAERRQSFNSDASKRSGRGGRGRGGPRGRGDGRGGRGARGGGRGARGGGPAKGRLVEIEAAATGSVKWTIYKEYLRAIGFKSCLAILAGAVAANVMNIASSLWLTAWSDDASNPETANSTSLKYVRIGIYGVLGVSEAFLMLVGNLITFYATLRASSLLHNMMLDHILRAPMSFYDTTPSGRVLNRFGSDIDNTDIAIRMSIRQFLQSFFKAIVTFSIISVQTPFFLLPLIPLGILYYVVQRYYIMTSRQLRRLASTSKSPVFSHFAETVSGTTSIRAFQVENEFNVECDRKNDINNATNILATGATRWLSIRLEFLGNTIVLLAALFAVFSRGDIEASTVGLSLSYALTATSTLSMFVRASADLENNLVSVERCIEYTRTPTEADLEIESTKPKKSWPDTGIIEFKEYAARYRDGLDLVLKNVNFGVKAGEKVGIVGRTGAGKSSLTVALFRIVEPANGTIIIDGVDVRRIGLHDLRCGLTIIPQDPVLFTGSLRLNLDPFGKYDDSELWTSLKLAHLQQFVDSLSSGLDHGITEGGDNLSVGQRQLVCLARALLRKSKILILDEATAAVDLETDDLIQKTIREEFADCTILTIAHRLNTILDYDRVLVMDQGTVLEFDTPKSLLDNQHSVFHSMAKDAGLIASGGNGEADKQE